MASGTEPAYSSSPSFFSILTLRMLRDDMQPLPCPLATLKPSKYYSSFAFSSLPSLMICLAHPFMFSPPALIYLLRMPSIALGTGHMVIEGGLLPPQKREFKTQSLMITPTWKLGTTFPQSHQRERLAKREGARQISPKASRGTAGEGVNYTASHHVTFL